MDNPLVEGGEDCETQFLHALAESEEQIKSLEAEVVALTKGVEEERARLKEVWRMNCKQLGEYDAAMASKEATPIDFQLGDWVPDKFPWEETGKQ